MLRISGKEILDFISQQERLGNVENAWPTSAAAILGPKALSVSAGKLHTKLRKLNSISFRPGALNSFIPKIENITKILMDKHFDTMAPFDQTCKTILTSIVFQCLFGVEEVMTDEFQTQLCNWNVNFIDYTAGILSVPINLPGFAFYKSKIAREKLVHHLIPLIKNQMKLYNDSGKDEKYKTALVALMETPMDDGSYLNEYEMGEQALLLYFAGHETTTSFMTNLFKLFHDHPQILQKARQEQIELFDNNRPITSEDLTRMVYLDACIKETLRLRTIVPGVFKKVEQDLVYKDIMIPKGTLLSLNLCGSTYGCEDHTAPLDEFEPARFLNSSGASFIPFGIGKHTCIGKPLFFLEAKIITSLILRNYEFTQIGESKQQYFPSSVTKNLFFDFKSIIAN
jgi:retinoid hydroxylase